MNEQPVEEGDAPAAPPGRVDRVLDFVARWLGLCGHGKKGNWSVRVADYFFIDCGCCWFWRGVTVGASVASVLGLIAIVLWSLIDAAPATPPRPVAVVDGSARERARMDEQLAELAQRLATVERGADAVRGQLDVVGGAVVRIQDGIVGLDARFATWASDQVVNSRPRLKK